MPSSQSDLGIPGPAEWFAWLEDGNLRQREIAISQLASRSAARAQKERRDSNGREIMLTDYGVAHHAAIYALVLADPMHEAHRRVLDRVRAEEAPDVL